MCLQTTFIQVGIIALVTMGALVVGWCVSARQLVPRLLFLLFLPFSSVSLHMCLQTTFIQGGIIALVTLGALVVAWCVSARQLVPRPIPARRSSTTHTALRALMASSAVLPLSVPQRAKQSG